VLILRIVTICGWVIVSRLAAQNAPNSASSKDEAQGTPAVLACPSTNEPLQDHVTFNWKPGSQTVTYRLLLGPTPGADRDGDSAIITGLQGQFAGLPPGQNLYVTLWSYDSSGKPVQPPSFCFIKTAPGTSVTAYRDLPQTGLTGVSLGSVALDQTDGTAGAAQTCQQRCNLNAACHGYTYFPAANGNSAAVCDLKSQITASYRSECCVSALKTAMADAVLDAVSLDAASREAAVPPPTPPLAVTPRSAPALASEAVAAAPVPIPPAPVAPPPSAPAPPAPTPAPIAPAPVVLAPPTRAAPVAPKAVTRAAGLTGDWVNQFGAINSLVQRGAVISGAYSDASQPSLSGTFQGTFDGKTLRATLTWKSGADSSHGTLLLTLTSDGRLDGTWTDANGVSGPWTMARHQ
jgi:hypothetical protein